MLFLKLQLKKNFYFLQIYHVQYFLFVIFRTPAQFVAWKFRGKIAAMYVSYLGGFIQYLGWIFADICKPMLQAKRLLAVVVGSHDTQQHELSLKEGDKVSVDYHGGLVMFVTLVMLVIFMTLVLVVTGIWQPWYTAAWRRIIWCWWWSWWHWTRWKGGELEAKPWQSKCVIFRWQKWSRVKESLTHAYLR